MPARAQRMMLKRTPIIIPKQISSLCWKTHNLRTIYTHKIPYNDMFTRDVVDDIGITRDAVDDIGLATQWPASVVVRRIEFNGNHRGYGNHRRI